MMPPYMRPHASPIPVPAAIADFPLSNSQEAKITKQEEAIRVMAAKAKAATFAATINRWSH
jgi:hypothetical protein